jgi:phosphoribosylformimino-5-aminoimidazole carboxamide ribonucleotide (ProFAR) isomerase
VLTDEVVSDVDVLGARVVDIIRGDRHRRLIVAQQHRRYITKWVSMKYPRIHSSKVH